MHFHQAPNIYIGEVHLKVSDLERSLMFYKDLIGFQVLERTQKSARLTVDGITTLLSLEQPETVIPKEPRKTGLYHFAILLPSRKELGKVLYHFLRIGLPLQGASDHYVSEALYLADPDGNGIEIYADRPSETWTWDKGLVDMATVHLDAESLLDEGKGEVWTGLPKGTVMGHVHLHVSDLISTEEFYRDGLGFEVVSRYGSHALFMSTGKYHHHFGLNTWNGVGAPAPSNNSVGLGYFHLMFPSEETRNQAVSRLEKLGSVVTKKDHFYITKDPSGNVIHLFVS